MIQSAAKILNGLANVLTFWKIKRFEGECRSDAAKRRAAELETAWQTGGLKAFWKTLLINRNFGKKD